MWRGSVGPGMSVSAPFVWRCLRARPLLRFHPPLIERGERISRTTLADKTSRRRPRHVAPKPGQTYEPKGLVKVREWITPALAASGLVLEAQPPTQPHRRVVIERTICRIKSA
jgi:hypothetical protein